jgi:hypothetical protein
MGEYKRNSIIGWTFIIAIGILFNPLYPIYLDRLIWNVIDITLAIILAAWAVKGYIDTKN